MSARAWNEVASYDSDVSLPVAGILGVSRTTTPARLATVLKAFGIVSSLHGTVKWAEFDNKHNPDYPGVVVQFDSVEARDKFLDHGSIAHPKIGIMMPFNLANRKVIYRGFALGLPRCDHYPPVPVLGDLPGTGDVERNIHLIPHVATQLKRAQTAGRNADKETPAASKSAATTQPTSESGKQTTPSTTMTEEPATATTTPITKEDVHKAPKEKERRRSASSIVTSSSPSVRINDKKSQSNNKKQRKRASTPNPDKSIKKFFSPASMTPTQPTRYIPVGKRETSPDEYSDVDMSQSDPIPATGSSPGKRERDRDSDNRKPKVARTPTTRPDVASSSSSSTSASSSSPSSSSSSPPSISHSSTSGYSVIKSRGRGGGRSSRHKPYARTQ